MTAVTRQGNAGIHYFQGKPIDLGFSANFDTALSPERGAAIKAVAKSALNQDVRVVGSLWDYDQSTDPQTRDLNMGHYLVEKPNGSRVVIAVHPIDASEALAIGDLFFDHLEKSGVNIVRAEPFEEGVFVRQSGEVYVHQETHTPNAVFLMNDTDISDIGDALGEMAGKVFNAAKKYKAQQPQASFELEGYTNEVFANAVIRGLNPENSTGEIQEIYQNLGVNLSDLHGRILQAERIPGTLNMIEKMVRRDTEGGKNLILCSYDTPTRGSLPMLTQNTTMDTGLAIGRIVLDANRYASSPSAEGVMGQTLHDFIEGYNKVTGLSLTPQEAFVSAKKALAILGAYGAGQDNQVTPEVLQEFFEKSLKPFSERLQELESAMQLQTSNEYTEPFPE